MLSEPNKDEELPPNNFPLTAVSAIPVAAVFKKSLRWYIVFNF
jgi:hypothetical protein